MRLVAGAELLNPAKMQTAGIGIVSATILLGSPVARIARNRTAELVPRPAACLPSASCALPSPAASFKAQRRENSVRKAHTPTFQLATCSDSFPAVRLDCIRAVRCFTAADAICCREKSGADRSTFVVSVLLLNRWSFDATSRRAMHCMLRAGPPHNDLKRRGPRQWGTTLHILTPLVQLAHAHPPCTHPLVIVRLCCAAWRDHTRVSKPAGNSLCGLPQT